MEKSLKVDTKTIVEKNGFDESIEPASPTAQYFLSEVATLYILSIFELEIGIDSSLIYDFFNGPFVNSHPRLSCIPIEDKKGRKMWKKVDVNVEDHIKTPKFPEDLSEKSYSEYLDDYMSKLATSKMELHKPLWEVHCFNYPTSIDTKSTLIIKFHHAVGDGGSLMGIVLTCFKRVDDPTLPLSFFPASSSSKAKPPKTNLKTSLMKTINFVPNFVSTIFWSLYDFGQNLKVTLVEDDRTPIRSGTTNMNNRPSSARVCSVTLYLVDVKKIKSLLKTTVNDVVAGIISLAARTYIQEVEQESQKNVRMTASIAVNTRSSKSYTSPEKMRNAKTWGNRMSVIQLSLPNLDDDHRTNPIKYIMKVHKILKRKRMSIRNSTRLSTWGLDATRMFGGLKAATQSFENSWKNTSLGITNVIGPMDQMSIANHPIKGFYFVPTNLNLSLTVSVMSYMEKIRIGLVIENGFIDQQRLVNCVENAYQLIILQAFPASTKATISVTQ